MPWRIGMAERMLTQFETDTLPRFLEIQRWYASKGTPIERARLVDHAVWDAGEFSWMLPLLQLDGPPEASTYFVPLALAWEEQDEERFNRLTPAALAKVRQQSNVGVMADAFYDEAFCRAVVEAIRAGKEIATNAGRLRFTATDAFSDLPVALAALPVARPSAVSSNTVVTFDETLFLKGYRNLRDGVNPELEMGWFLTSVARFPHCVPVLGALEYLGDDGRVVTLAMVQAYVTNQGDGWVYTLGYLERFLEELRTAGADTFAAAAPAQAHGGFLALMVVLGRRTAELHLALAARTGDAAFDPEPFEPGDVEAMRERALDDATATLALLRDRLLLLPRPRKRTRKPFCRATRRCKGASARQPGTSKAASRPATTATTTWAKCWWPTTISSSSISKANPRAASRSAAPRARRCATSRACCARSTTRAGRLCGAWRRTPTSSSGSTHRRATGSLPRGMPSSRPIGRRWLRLERRHRSTRIFSNCSNLKRRCTSCATNSTIAPTGSRSRCRACWH